MRLVYICSPLRGDMEANKKRADEYCAYAASCGVVPLAPHTIFTRYLDENIPEQRKQGFPNNNASEVVTYRADWEMPLSYI